MPKSTLESTTPCPYRHSVSVEDDEISLIDLFRVVWRRKTYISAFVCLSLLGVSIYLFSTPDIYKAEAIIMPLQGRNTIALPSNLLGIEGLKEMIGENMPGMLEAPNSSKIRTLLTSRRLNLMLVEKFDLLPILFTEKWDKTKLRWHGEENQNKYADAVIQGSKKLVGASHDFLMAMPSPLDGAELLRSKISVKTIKSSNLLTIEFEDRDPNFATLMISRYIEALDEYLRFEAISRANDSRNYISTLLQAQSHDQTKKRLEELSLAFAEQELYAKMKSSFLFEVVDPPILPEKPIKPKRPIILMLTVFASLFIAILSSFAFESIKAACTKKTAVQ